MPLHETLAGRVDARGPGLRAYASGLVLLTAAVLMLALAPPAQGAVGDLVFRGCLADGGAAGCAPVVSLFGASGVAVNAAGTSAYVASDNEDSLTIFTRDRAGGGLGFHSCLSLTGTGGCTQAPLLDGATGVAVSPDGASVYVASASSDSLTHHRRTAAGGLIPIGSMSGQALDGAFAVAVSPEGNIVYLVARDRGIIQPFTRSANGSLGDAPSCHGEAGVGACLPAFSLAGARGVAVSPDGSSVYVAASSDDSVTHFSVGLFSELTLRGCYDDGNTGGCTPVGTLDGAASVAVSPDGASVYVVGDDGDTLTTFARAADGALAFRGCHRDNGATGCAAVASLSGARGVTVSPDGASVYVTSVFDDALTTFSRAPDGSLAFRGCVAVGGGEGCAPVASLDVAVGVAVSPDGSSVYASANGTGSISHFSRELPAGSPGTPGGGGGPGAGVPAPPGVRCNGRQATLLAAGPLTRGTARADVIVGRAGVDRILGRGGADLICGRGGADRLEGGAGRDLLIGDAGADVLLGGLGVDVLRGGAGRDRLTGGAGRDRLLGGPGLDRQRQ